MSSSVPSPSAETAGNGVPAGAVAVLGEALIDLVAIDVPGGFHALPGGSPANVAIGLARLDVPVRLAARISTDPFGDQLRSHLTTNGVDCRAVVRAQEPSSLAIVHRGPTGSVRYDFRMHGTCDWQWRDGEPDAVLDSDVRAVHCGSLAAAVAPGADAVERAVERARRHATISFDPNVRADVLDAVPGARERIERLLGLADVIKISDEDLDWFRPGCDPETFARERIRAGAAIVAVTCGGQGAVVAGASAGVRWLPSHPVRVVDTVGAGDSHVSSVLSGLYKRGLVGAAARPALRALSASVLAEVFDDAARAAALTCGRPGADPPTTRELAVDRSSVA